MSGLVCTPSIVPPATANQESPIVNDGWFPDVDPDDVRADMRIRDAITPARLRAAVIAAILTLRVDLKSWGEAHRAAGHASLEAVPADTIDGKSILALTYARAIGALTKAELIERNRDFDQAGGGQRDVDDMGSTIGELRRDAAHAVRDLLGRTRTAVELI